jgi:manganese/iron transport system ATP-binding protein
MSWISKLNPFHKKHDHLEDAVFLEVKDVTVQLNGHKALEHLSFKLDGGEQIAVVGPNGAGKSTMFKLIAGVIKPDKGFVHLGGHVPGKHICIAYLPQRSEVAWNFPATVRDVVMMGRVRRLGLGGWPKKEDWEKADEFMETVRITHLAGRQISELSGGQQQRMFIAQALAQEAELVMMDEPFSGLDAVSQEEVLRIIAMLKEHGVTVLVAMHDLSMASDRFEKVMLLNQRIMGFGDPKIVLSEQKLIEVYGNHLHMVKTEDGVMFVDDACC